MIQITFTFDTLEEAAKALHHFAFANEAPGVQPATVETIAEVVKEEKPKRPRKAKAEKPVEVPAVEAPAVEAVDATPAGEHSVTLDDLRAALREVYNKFDAKVVQDILKKFDVVRVGDVPVEKFGAFMAACQDRLQ